MGVIIRNRTIRPSTRDANAPYRIKVENAKLGDEIVIFIDHESKDYRAIYKCRGDLFQESDSIHFKVEDEEDEISINWMKGKIPEKIR
ncbi:hypothetical protein [uncultured Kriegella sp.]|uniref:hypothetical protein n=1 Tax=uncultured Kriegella sp. TaxID=1798910 RepID=UPI0030DC7F00|tara:strand:+ start:102081 stop:102344 length:264 start_codon:yes stop_codon:yes gene_type:complete